ncbi:MAG: imidazole glycerol phosphate synthase subunit HisF [Raineya sp.]
MLKRRIIAVLTVKDDIVVQSIGFQKYLPIGKPEIAVEFLNKWGIDEIAYNDISATAKGKKPNFELIKKVAKKCFVPLAVGGGISSLDDVKKLTQSGADKVIVNNLLLQNPNAVKSIAENFGSQCLIASLDIKKEGQTYKPYHYLTRMYLPYTLQEWIRKIQDMGAGELLVNSIDKDGSYQGFEIEAFKIIQNLTSIPIIALGGAKNARSFIELFEKTQVDAGAAGNFFHFTEHSVNICKAQINRVHPWVRLETNANYQNNPIDSNGRLLKKDDDILEHLLFVKIEKEII